MCHESNSSTFTPQTLQDEEEECARRIAANKDQDSDEYKAQMRTYDQLVYGQEILCNIHLHYNWRKFFFSSQTLVTYYKRYKIQVVEQDLSTTTMAILVK